jgi:hypothetical protein
MIFDDSQIQALVNEPKPTVELTELVPTTVKGRHRERQHSVTGSGGSGFRLIVRQLILDPSDFSVILAYEIPDTTGLFRLRRHNGDSHDHSNRLEGDTVRGFHVHLATERYQLQGFREDGYAEPTNSYTDVIGAIRYMLEVAQFVPPAQSALPI